MLNVVTIAPVTESGQQHALFCIIADQLVFEGCSKSKADEFYTSLVNDAVSLGVGNLPFTFNRSATPAKTLVGTHFQFLVYSDNTVEIANKFF